ncbi:MAG: STAS domain-containing protein [Actinobacteria bacterium]|nr:STAS domain-containing protein [Actinomycetota bacterium]
MRTEIFEEIPVISVAGEIDHFTAKPIEERIMELTAGGEKYLILNFQEVSYLDSAGVALIILAIQKVNPVGGSVALVSENRNVLKILEIAGITQLTQNFAIFSSLDDALSAIRERKD